MIVDIIYPPQDLQRVIGSNGEEAPNAPRSNQDNGEDSTLKRGGMCHTIKPRMTPSRALILSPLRPLSSLDPASGGTTPVPSYTSQCTNGLRPWTRCRVQTLCTTSNGHLPDGARNNSRYLAALDGQLISIFGQDPTSLGQQYNANRLVPFGP